MTLYEFTRRNDRLDLLLEWDYAANKGFDPRKMPPSSRQRVSWVCEKGHHWNAMITARTGGKTGCPYCAGQKAIPGETDLATLRPDLLVLWDTEKNGEASQVCPGSHRRVWWKCRNGHSWQQKVFSVVSGSGCPYCSGYIPTVGETDLATTHPKLAAEWDMEKNSDGPSSISAGSNKKVWWRCKRGHSYEATVYSRQTGDGCPYCSGKRVLSGFNDLLTTDPELCREWDAAKNSLSPAQITRGSHKRVWWKCSLGHSYEAAVYSRMAGNGCPYCAGRKVLAGFNDLSTTHPKVAAQWAQELNGSVTPEMVTKGCNKKFWWQCSEGHCWQAAVFSRTRKKASDCPICAGTAKLKRIDRYHRDDIIRIRRNDRKPGKTVTPDSVAV